MSFLRISSMVSISALLSISACSDSDSPDGNTESGAAGTTRETTGTVAGSSPGPSREIIPTYAEDDGTDSDGDGLTDHFEIYTSGTDPIHADTDGDGFDDPSELTDNSASDNPYYRNPRIADIPRLKVEVLSAPRVFIRQTASNGQVHSFDNSRSVEESSGYTTSETSGISAREEVSSTLGAEVGSELGLLNIGVNSKISASDTETFGKEESLSWSSSQSRENRNTLSTSEAFSKSTEVTETGGRVEVTVMLRNNSNVAYELEDLNLSIAKFDERGGKVIDIGGLNIQTENRFFPLTTLKPGGTLGPLVFAAGELELEQAYALLRDGSMSVRTASYDLSDELGSSYTHRHNQIDGRTATVVIDFGDRHPPETHLVAARGPDGEGIDFKTLMETLELEYEIGTALWKFRDRTGKTETGLVRLEDVKTNSAVGGFWVVSQSIDTGRNIIHKRCHPIPGGLEVSKKDDAINEIVESLDLTAMQIRPRHLVKLVYIKDGDRDGLGDRTENLLGTNPEVFDTDGDGLGDGDELRQARSPLIGKALVELASVSSDDKRLRVRLNARDGETARVTMARVNWGDDTPPTEVSIAGNTTIEVEHEYADFGEFPIEVTGITEPPEFGATSAAKVRLAPALVRRWGVRTTAEEYAHMIDSVAAMPDGGVVVGGVLNDPESKKNVGGGVARYSATGKPIWDVNLGEEVRFVNVAADSQGRIYAADSKQLILMNADGSVLWRIEPKVNNAKNIRPRHVVVDNKGNAYVGMNGLANDTNHSHFFIGMVDLRGHVQWSHRFESSITPLRMAPTDGGLIVVDDDKTDDGRRARRFMRILADGTVELDETISVNVGTDAIALAPMADDRVIVVGGAGVSTTCGTATAHVVNSIDTVVWMHDKDGRAVSIDPRPDPHMSVPHSALVSSNGFYTYEITAPVMSEPEGETERERAEKLLAGISHVSIGAYSSNGQRLGRLRLPEGDFIVFLALFQQLRTTNHLAPGPGGDIYVAGYGADFSQPYESIKDLSGEGYLVRLSPNPQPTQILYEE